MIVTYQKIVINDNIFYKETGNDSFAIKIKLLSKVLYEQQRKFKKGIESDPSKFSNMIEQSDPRLQGFFEEMTDAIIPDKRTDSNKEAAKRSIVIFCYLLVGLRNKFTNSLKLDLGIYLVGAGSSCTAIDTLANMGITTCYKTIENYKKDLALKHPQKINENFGKNVSNISFCS